MSEPLLNILKLLLLVLLYLFFFRVLRAVWVEVKGPPPAAEKPPRKARPRRDRRPGPKKIPQLVAVEPAEMRNRAYDLEEEVTVGRAAGCAIAVDDTYVSQVHARIFRNDDEIMVEDLGSTNGSYLNRRRLVGPMIMKRGDRLQVGDTILELR